ncbi:cyclic nucleotide-binding domain-containing protein [Brevibacillus centrosporus]|uniref:cyclic nucleotide-binding domain-containing protein n=1 Tax=Brevibacillus centrosporus TaxID=54910 RepID=UPI002E1FFF3D|nr:cyclic nucleotide-binding domain-containing protein [Brevibacillus centrosporus]
MPVTDVFDFLREHPLLRGVPDSELQIVARLIEPVSISDGEPLLVEGDASTDCFFIHTGSVQVSSRNLVGNTLLLAELGPGSLVGEMGLLQNERRSASVTANHDVVALRLERQSFELLAKVSPLFHESLLYTVRIRMLHRRLRKATIWSVIPDAELRGLAEVITTRKVAKGETILETGARADHFFMVSRGRFEARRKGRKKSLLLEGDFFGEELLLADVPSEYTLTAFEDSELMVLGKEEFLSILGCYVPIQKQFLEIIRIRHPHALPKLANELRTEQQLTEDTVVAFVPKARERWMDSLLWLGGSFLLLSLLALFLHNHVLHVVTLLAGGLVGPVTFVAYMRDHQLLGVKQTQVSLLFAASGIFAVPVAFLLERVWFMNNAVSTIDYSQLVAPLAISLIEEGAKLVICFLFARPKRMPFLMDALVFGAAAGMGFAAIESMLYGWSHLEQASSPGMLSILWIRALLSPFGHGAWTAIGAAGVWLIVSALRPRAQSSDKRAWKVFGAALLVLIVIALHALWDFPFGSSMVTVGVMAAIACMDVVLLFILIRAGRKEELHSFTTMNPYVQEQLQLLHNVPEDTAAGELYCGSCGSASPRSARYCARCGHALRV